MKCYELLFLAQEPKNKVHEVCIKKLELFRFLQDNNEKEEKKKGRIFRFEILGDERKDVSGCWR